MRSLSGNGFSDGKIAEGKVFFKAGINQNDKLKHNNMRKFDNKLVSVIIPVYNAGQFLEETLRSALEQTYEDVEIVLVDDCSTDNSSEIIKEAQENYPNVIYHRQEKNQGAAVARNTALNIAKGRYVAFLDSDDLWIPEKTKWQMDDMRKRNASISFSAIDFVDENDERLKDIREVKGVIDYRFLLKNTMIATSTVIVDRAKTGDFQMPLRRSGQDYATWLMLMRDGTKAYGINEVFCHYRVRSNSLSSNKWKSIKQVWEIQTQDEKINKVFAAINVCGFVWNAFKKRFL